MKTYHFRDESWWASNGCDCCEDILMDAYNCEQTSLYGPAHSVEECYRQALMSEGVLQEEDDPVNTLTLEQLEYLCETRGIRVLVEESFGDSDD